ncbi:MAG: hypothetical protein J0M19_06375 [Sphingomonadales bacterium]|nr:hypothetical protein [Sphingomonadales bacterium]
MRSLFAAIPFAFGLLAAAPAAAQEGAAEPKVNMVIVYGDDKCPESTGDEIVVCPRMDEGERYRIPPTLRTSSAPSNQAWSQRVRSLETVGRSGTMSCSPTGAGGWTGCTGQLLAQARGEKETDPGVRAGQLIAEERAKRLATIDAEAADTQSRVEEVEKQMEDRRKAEEEAAAKGQSAPPPLPEPK